MPTATVARIALVALHPSDGEDAFQPPASQHRIDRLESVQTGVKNSTPTFVVEAGPARRGYDAWSDVQRDILTEEMSRQNVSNLGLSVEKTENGFRASVLSTGLVQNDGTQLTMMVLEHGKPMPDGFINPRRLTIEIVFLLAWRNAMLATPPSPRTSVYSRRQRARIAHRRFPLSSKNWLRGAWC